jgi:hypothetical protein
VLYTAPGAVYAAPATPPPQPATATPVHAPLFTPGAGCCLLISPSIGDRAVLGFARAKFCGGAIFLPTRMSLLSTITMRLFAPQNPRPPGASNTALCGGGGGPTKRNLTPRVVKFLLKHTPRHATPAMRYWLLAVAARLCVVVSCWLAGWAGRGIRNHGRSLASCVLVAASLLAGRRFGPPSQISLMAASLLGLATGSCTWLR